MKAFWIWKTASTPQDSRRGADRAPTFDRPVRSGDARGPEPERARRRRWPRPGAVGGRVASAGTPAVLLRRRSWRRRPSVAFLAAVAVFFAAVPVALRTLAEAVDFAVDFLAFLAACGPVVVP